MFASLQGANFMNPTTGYQAFLDVPAAIDHWILSVAPKSADAFRLSGYWYKPRNGKLTMRQCRLARWKSKHFPGTAPPPKRLRSPRFLTFRPPGG